MTNHDGLPCKDGILEGIQAKGIFLGPIKLKGTCPYIIVGLREAYEAYQKLTSSADN